MERGLGGRGAMAGRRDAPRGAAAPARHRCPEPCDRRAAANWFERGSRERCCRRVADRFRSGFALESEKRTKLLRLQGLSRSARACGRTPVGVPCSCSQIRGWRRRCGPRGRTPASSAGLWS